MQGGYAAPASGYQPALVLPRADQPCSEPWTWCGGRGKGPSPDGGTGSLQDVEHQLYESRPLPPQHYDQAYGSRAAPPDEKSHAPGTASFMSDAQHRRQAPDVPLALSDPQAKPGPTLPELLDVATPMLRSLLEPLEARLREREEQHQASKQEVAELKSQCRNLAQQLEGLSRESCAAAKGAAEAFAAAQGAASRGEQASHAALRGAEAMSQLEVLRVQLQEMRSKVVDLEAPRLLRSLQPPPAPQAPPPLAAPPVVEPVEAPARAQAEAVRALEQQLEERLGRLEQQLQPVKSPALEASGELVSDCATRKDVRMLSAVEKLAMRMEEAPLPVVTAPALYLPEYIRSQPVLICTEEIGTYFITNARLNSAGMGVQCRNSPNMEDRAEQIIALGQLLRGTLSDGWLRLDPTRLPDAPKGQPAASPVQNVAGATEITASFASIEEWTENIILQKLHTSEVPELIGASIRDVRGVSKGLSLDRPLWCSSLADMEFPLVLTLQTKPSLQPLRIDEHDRCLWHLAQRLDRQERLLLDVDGGKIQGLISHLERLELETSEMRRAHVASVALLQQQDQELIQLRGVSSLASENATAARLELERQERQLADLRRQQSLDLSEAAASASGLRAQVMERIDWLNEVILLQQQSLAEKPSVDQRLRQQQEAAHMVSQLAQHPTPFEILARARLRVQGLDAEPELSPPETELARWPLAQGLSFLEPIEPEQRDAAWTRLLRKK